VDPAGDSALEEQMSKKTFGNGADREIAGGVEVGG
jgi:hypothetical protein